MGADRHVDERRIAELWRRVYVRRRPAGRVRIDADVVAELAATRSVLALPRLVELTLENSVCDVAAAAIAAIVSDADPARLPAADAQVRLGARWSDPWAGVGPAAFERHVRHCADPMGVVLAGGMCRNGFVREHALTLSDQYAATAPGPYVRLLLVRANDWVPQVRQAAVARLDAAVQDVAGGVLIRALPLVQRLYQVERLHDVDVVDRLVARAVGPDWQNLISGLSAEYLSVRRSCAQLSLSAPHDRRREAVQLILDGVADPVSRRLAAQTMMTSGASRGAITRLLEDRATDVRLTALHHLLSTGDVEAVTLAGALNDPSRRVRGIAQYHGRQRGIDPAAHYRACLERRSPDPVCIKGLGEVGQPFDADRALPLVTDERARVRAAAVALIGRLAPSHHLEVLYQAVADTSPRVSRTARRALVSSGTRLNPSRVRQLITACVTEQAVTNALLLVDHVDRWSQLRLYLDALPHLQADTAAIAIDRIQHWHNGYRTTWNIDPSPDDLDQTRIALRTAEHTLPATLRSRLGEIVAQ